MSPAVTSGNCLNNEIICPICLDFLDTCHKSQLCCTHNFHKSCIVRWDKYRSVCPCCVAPIKYHQDFYFFKKHDLCGRHPGLTINLTPHIHTFEELHRSRIRIINTINSMVKEEIDRKLEAEIERLTARIANLHLDDDSDDDDI